MELSGHLLLKLTFVPGMLLCLALPWEVVVLLTTLHEGNKQVSTVVSQVDGDLGFSHLLLAHLHLCQANSELNTIAGLNAEPLTSFEWSSHPCRSTAQFTPSN